jgi:hypothetical protein
MQRQPDVPAKKAPAKTNGATAGTIDVADFEPLIG